MSWRLLQHLDSSAPAHHEIDHLQYIGEQEQNKKWCDPRNISILSRSCSPHLEPLSIICRPFYLPREISSIIVTAVYIPTQADTIYAVTIAGDFNKANFRKVMPNFHQHLSCPTRGPNTLDHCYTHTMPAHYRLLANRTMLPFSSH